jgi:hypothetical protein
MIRQRWDVDVSGTQDLISLANRYEDLVMQSAAEAFGGTQDDLLDELQYYPPPPSGSTYIRTFKLRGGWRLGLRRTDRGIEIVIENDVPYAALVVGSLAKAIAAARAFQARVHQGRWPLATETVSFWYEILIETFEEILGEKVQLIITAQSSRRAFTR